MANLPQEIVSEILSFLPVKNLIRFKCVCKLWLYLISNPNFIKTHLEKSHLFNNYTHHKLILNHLVAPYSIKSLSLDINENSNAVDLDYPKRDPFGRVSLVGSCNGLVCIVIDLVGIFLWNPSTKISKELPYSGNRDQLHFMASYGFGYDQNNDDYKVVKIETVENAHQVNVYSLRYDSWEKIVCFSYRSDRFNSSGKYANGVLYWEVVPESFVYSSIIIVSLDLENETFGEIAQPCYGEDHVFDTSLGILEGQLSIFCYFNQPNEKIDIWVMKEYGVRNTWIKLYTIIAPEICCHNPLCISMTGEILLNFNSSLVLYNPNSASFKNLKNCKLCASDIIPDAFTYIESLVSPHIYNEVPSLQH